MKKQKYPFSYVEETDELYLKLWPHRFDFLYAEHPAPGERPQWQTESRYGLSDRKILQGAYLYGVRFGPTTNYIVLDIDKGSLYHPSKDAMAITRMRDAMEDIGLIEGVFCTSSHSKGLHLYFPFEEAQKSWEVSLAITALLESKGFKFTPGHLEIFPNPRPYAPQGEMSLYNAHRIPMQIGSYLLNHDLEPMNGGRERFAQMWHHATAKNTLTKKTVTDTVKLYRRRQYRISTRANDFLNDLNADIEMGWTGPGMTNKILGRITMRSYIFGHVLYAPRPLEGEELVQDVIRIATSLPGFYELSDHVDELESKAKAWAQSIQKSKYYHYGLDQIEKGEGNLAHSKRKQQIAASREKIRSAIATLLDEGALPINATDRVKVLTQRFHIGGKTIYKHKELWHPEHLSAKEPVENPPDPPTEEVNSGPERVEGAPSPERSPILLEATGCNPPSDNGFGDYDEEIAEEKRCNSASQLPLFDVRKVIDFAKGHIQRRTEEAAKRRAQHYEAQLAVSKAKLLQQMKEYIDSGDPILMTEGLNWLRDHPEYRDQVL